MALSKTSHDGASKASRSGLFEHGNKVSEKERNEMPLSIDPESGGYFQDDYRGEIDSAAGEDGDAMSDREQLIAQRARALALEEAATFVATHVAIEPSVSGTTEPTFQGYLMREIVLVPGNHHIGLAYAAALQARAAAPAPGESNGV